MLWSLEEYCASQRAIDHDALAVSSRDFLKALHLPSVHPFCNQDDFEFPVDGVPPMGRLDSRFEGESPLQILITLVYMVAPSLLAMSELWLRLFAGAVGPLGLVYMITDELSSTCTKNTKKARQCSRIFPIICAVSLASNLVLMTDAMYVLDNGKLYGATLFFISLLLSIRAWFRYNLKKLGIFISIVVLLASHLILDYDTKTLSFGDKTKQVLIEEGLYYNDSNSLVSSIVQHWPQHFRTYNKLENGQATSWMPSGDSRTGLPFLANHVPKQAWQRVFLETVDQEYVALDIAFPPTGHNTSNPVYLVLHGLNGGTDEEYVNDLAMRRTAAGSTVVVMIARGLMDLPIRGWNLFHGARTTDAHTAALALRRVVSQDQVLIGVGYSMGAIILNNYVASYGQDCALDAAIAISGGLDMRYQEEFYRARRLWQPMLTETARDEFFLGKWGHRVKARLSESNFLGLQRAKDITELDIVAVAPYSGFDDVHHYYREMSALGDFQHKADGTLLEEKEPKKKVDSISIPLVVLQALDDPLVTWRATCANEGLMHPQNLVATGSGNLLLLLTKFGGHVGWPVGTLFFRNNWKWMSDAVMSFAEAVQDAKRLQREKQAIEKAEQERLQKEAEEEARLKVEEEARLKAEEEARLKAEEEARLKAEEEARLKAEEEARLKAEEEARLKAEEEARLKAEEEARLKAEEEARFRAQEEARLKAEEEVRSRAEEEARLMVEQEAQFKAEEEARLKAEEAARWKAEEEARLRAEEEHVE